MMVIGLPKKKLNQIFYSYKNPILASIFCCIDYIFGKIVFLEERMNYSTTVVSILIKNLKRLEDFDGF